MFVFVGGVGPNEANPKDILDQPCPACGSFSLQEKRVDQVLSLFFIPLITVHQGRPFRVCSACGWDTRLESGVRGAADPQLGASQAAPTHETHTAASSGGSGLACQQCGHAVQEKYLFCPFCGSSLN